MKSVKCFFLFVSILLSLPINVRAQDYHYDVNGDGLVNMTDMTFLLNKILGVPNPGEAEAIDLGLPSGVKWAACNVGATSPEGYGNYYAWGETEVKEAYRWDTYQHYVGTTTYRNLGNICGTQYDVAHVKWGGKWRMPSQADFNELVNNCTHIWTTYNNVRGVMFTGPNGKSVFFPAASYIYDTSIPQLGKYCSYWSGTQSTSYYNHAIELYINSYETVVRYYSRDYGRTVRPVQDK